MRAQRSGGILFKLAQHLWQIREHLGHSSLEFIFYSSLPTFKSHIEPPPTHTPLKLPGEIKVIWLWKVILWQFVMFHFSSVTSMVSLPPEAKKKQLFWICTNKRSCFYSNHRTLWKISPFNTSQSLLFKHPLPFVNQQTTLTQKGPLVMWLHRGGEDDHCCHTLQKWKVLFLPNDS